MSQDRWKSTWEECGRGDAYYAVLTHDAFRKDQLDDAAIEAFFASGEQDVDSVLATVRAHVAPGFAPTRTLSVCNAGHPQPLVYRKATGRWGLLSAVRDGPFDQPVVRMPVPW